MRDANQARGRGSQMGGPEGGLASVNDTEWLSEVRAGRKKAAVLRDAEELFKVIDMLEFLGEQVLVSNQSSGDVPRDAQYTVTS